MNLLLRESAAEVAMFLRDRSRPRATCRRPKAAPRRGGAARPGLFRRCCGAGPGRAPTPRRLPETQKAAAPGRPYPALTTARRVRPAEGSPLPKSPPSIISSAFPPAGCAGSPRRGAEGGGLAGGLGGGWEGGTCRGGGGGNFEKFIYWCGV